MGGKWRRTPKRVRADIEKRLKELIKNDLALQSAQDRIKELKGSRLEKSEEIEKLRDELLEIEFEEFYLPTKSLQDFLQTIYNKFDDPEINRLINERLDKAIDILKEKAVHKSKIMEIENLKGNEHDVVLIHNEYGGFLVEIYNPESPDHKGQRVYSMYLFPKSMDGETKAVEDVEITDEAD